MRLCSKKLHSKICSERVVVLLIRSFIANYRVHIKGYFADWVVRQQNPMIIKTIYRLFPEQVARILLIQDAMSSARKSIIWEFPFDDMEVELDRLLESLDEQISDVPADYLSKGYLIFIVRLPHAQLHDQADGSVQIEINQIDPKDMRVLDGLCWKDWRSGSGRNYARGLLRTCCPTADTPFVHISVGLEGRVVQRINESHN